MFENLKKLEQEIEEKLSSIKDSKSLSSLKVDIFGKKGSITNYLKSISSLPDDQKKEAGQTINELKNKINNEKIPIGSSSIFHDIIISK